MKPNSILQLA
jgi:hypothetical protein